MQKCYVTLSYEYSPAYPVICYSLSALFFLRAAAHQDENLQRTRSPVSQNKGAVYHMGKHDDDNICNVTSDLQKMFVWLAKVCLTEQPSDVERFCLNKLARKLGVRIESDRPLSREVSLLQDDDVSEFVRDVKEARHALIPISSQAKNRKCGYVSSDESERTEPVPPVFNKTESRRSIFGDESDGSDDGGEKVTGKVTLVNEKEERNPQFFNRHVYTEMELELMVHRYVDDDRMVSLFRAWDGDGSGAVDFVELVMALHKFEDVARAGVDIKVAADALVEFVESDSERELKLPQFAKVIIVFAKNTFNKSFEDVADHMLNVARSTSEAAVLQAARGVDVSEIEAFDKEEQKFVRETAQCVSVNVENNISRLRTNRIGAGSAAPKN